MAAPRERDSRIFCRCGLMWDQNAQCPHCDRRCGSNARTCARCAQYNALTAADLNHRS